MKENSGKIPLIVSIEELRNLSAWISYLAKKSKKDQEIEILINSVDFLNAQIDNIASDCLEVRIFIPLSECLLYTDFLSIRKESLFDKGNPLRDIRRPLRNKIRTAIKTTLSEFVVTTADLKQDYEVISPVYFQLSNKGLSGGRYDDLLKVYKKDIEEMRISGQIDNQESDFENLIFSFSLSINPNNFDKAYFIALQEIKKKAMFIGADAIVGMRQDIDMDTTGFQFFYMQMYGTAVRYVEE